MKKNMNSFKITVDGTMYNVEQPSPDYNIFYLNRKRGTFCMSKSKDSKWILDLAINNNHAIPVDSIGAVIDQYIKGE